MDPKAGAELVSAQPMAKLGKGKGKPTERGSKCKARPLQKPRITPMLVPNFQVLQARSTCQSSPFLIPLGMPEVSCQASGVTGICFGFRFCCGFFFF